MFALNKVKEETNKALFAANKVKETTNKALFAANKVKETTNKPLFAAEKVKETTKKVNKMALGAVKAIDEAGKKGKIQVVGYDNIPSVQDLIRSGAITATIEQHPDLMGRYGVRMAVGILDGKLGQGGEFLVPLETIKRK